MRNTESPLCHSLAATMTHDEVPATLLHVDELLLRLTWSCKKHNRNSPIIDNSRRHAASHRCCTRMCTTTIQGSATGINVRQSDNKHYTHPPTHTLTTSYTKCRTTTNDTICPYVCKPDQTSTFHLHCQSQVHAPGNADTHRFPMEPYDLCNAMQHRRELSAKFQCPR